MYDKNLFKKSSANELKQELFEYFRRGYLKTIYEQEEFMICNFCNSMYIYFPFIRDLTNNGQLGTLLSKVGVKEILSIRHGDINTMGEKYLEKYTTAVINTPEKLARYGEIFNKYKNNPGPDISYDLEREIAEAVRSNGMKL